MGVGSNPTLDIIFVFFLIIFSLSVKAKETYQRAMMQLMEERQQHEVAIAEYKQVDMGHLE